jgi:hypothetical protein
MDGVLLDLITTTSESGIDPTESIFHALAVLLEYFGTLTDAGRSE